MKAVDVSTPPVFDEGKRMRSRSHLRFPVCFVASEVSGCEQGAPPTDLRTSCTPETSWTLDNLDNLNLKSPEMTRTFQVRWFLEAEDRWFQEATGLVTRKHL